MKNKAWWQEEPVRVLTRQEILEIQGIWEAIEGAEPEISTERLFAMVEDAYNNGRPKKDRIDAGDISEAMAPDSLHKADNKVMDILHEEEQ